MVNRNAKKRAFPAIAEAELVRGRAIGSLSAETQSNVLKRKKPRHKTLKGDEASLRFALLVICYWKCSGEGKIRK